MTLAGEVAEHGVKAGTSVERWAFVVLEAMQQVVVVCQVEALVVWAVVQQGVEVCQTVWTVAPVVWAAA